MLRYELIIYAGLPELFTKPKSLANKDYVMSPRQLADYRHCRSMLIHHYKGTLLG